MGPQKFEGDLVRIDFWSPVGLNRCEVILLFIFESSYNTQEFVSYRSILSNLDNNFPSLPWLFSTQLTEPEIAVQPAFNDLLHSTDTLYPTSNSERTIPFNST
jgi:hypothetical protein